MFAFNERAIRAYRKAGFVVEGRARQSIWRDGRYWDELQMSILDSDWAARRQEPGPVGRDRVAPNGDEPVPAARGRPEGLTMASSGPAADAARTEVRAIIDDKGHAVDNARRAVARLDEAFAAGDLVRTPALDAMLGDLMVALEQDDGQKLGGKSAEAARFILRAISRELDNA